MEQLSAYRQTILAKDRVRYVGDPVAVVFADDPYLAEDAAEHVVVDDRRIAGRSCMPIRRPANSPQGLSTEAAVIRKGYGDIDAAFRDAHAIVSLSLAIGRHSGVPMETRGAIGRYDAATDMLEMHGAAKVPHWNRTQIATMLGRDPASIHLLRRPCRRRVRHSRRALSGGCSGLPCRVCASRAR